VLLTRKGHDVIRYTVRNEEIRSLSRARVAADTIWNQKAFRELRQLIQQTQPEVVHCHNIFPRISPAIYYAAKGQHVPVIQTLHNYRLFCPAAAFFRDGATCEECAARFVPWPGVLHGCYRNSRAATATVASMLVVHRAFNSWDKRVDAYIAPSHFSMTKFIDNGLSPEKLHVKPNFLLEDPGPADSHGSGGVFLGRLSHEKGPDVLVEAWRELSQVPLRIVGDGPQKTALERTVAERGLSQVRFLGHSSHRACLEAVRQSAFLIVPSRSFETFGRAIVEAYALGRPVIASRHGALSELVKDGTTGLLFSPGDASDLAGKVRWMTSHRDACREMGQAARREYEAKYTSDRNYGLLMAVYQRALT